MKISTEIFIENIEKEKMISSNIFFLFGSDLGTISKLTEIIYNHFAKKNEIEEKQYFDQKYDSFEKIKEFTKNQSFFSKKNFIIIKNPNEKFPEEFNNIKLSDNILIIDGEGIKANSKLKIFFDKHKIFISVPCYPLKKNEKINIIDKFLNKKKIILTKEVYWYLIENISNEYLVLEKELEKILLCKNQNLSVDNLKKILIQNENTKLDNIFFICAEKNKDILLIETKSLINSTKESYDILKNIKRFVQIIASAIEKKECQSYENLTDLYLPKYLFMKKNIFKEILKNNDNFSIIKMFALIQKTEILLRKNTSHYFEITQRFLLNFSKILK